MMSSQPDPVVAEIMKVRSNLTASLAFSASVNRSSWRTRSILFRTRIFGCGTSFRASRIASASPRKPRSLSIRSRMISASLAPPQAEVTMARSSLRRGLKMPGVSMKTIWAFLWIAMPRMTARVVCTLWLTIDTLAPTKRLTSVDLPALVGPIKATKPDRVGVLTVASPPSWVSVSVISSIQFASEALAQTPSRSSILVAATCSAARLERSMPISGFRPGISTITVKLGS